MNYTKQDLQDYFKNTVRVTLTNKHGKYPAYCRFKSHDNVIIYTHDRVSFNMAIISDHELLNIRAIIMQYYKEHGYTKPLKEITT